MLAWVASPVNVSLLVGGDDSLATVMHTELLRYMGDGGNRPDPAAAVRLCALVDHLGGACDVLYVLILKQLTGNPRKQSISRGWQMLCLCCGCFVASELLEPFVLSFVLRRRNARSTGSAVAHYARYCEARCVLPPLEPQGPRRVPHPLLLQSA